MGTRSFILPFLTAIIISGFLIFLSCASKERVQNEDGLEELSEETPGNTSDDMGSLDELEKLDDDLTKDLEKSSESNEADLPSEEELAQAADEIPEDGELPADENLGTSSVEENVPNDGGNVSEDGGALGLPSDEELAKAEELEAAASQEDAEMTNMDSEMTKGSKRSKGRNGGSGFDSPSWSGGSTIPSIPAQAFMKDGSNLNRFYFVRSGDSSEVVSELIFGTQSEANKLGSWNRGRWNPGKAIYYQSPKNPQDQQMISFYQENNLNSEEYVVQKGDWLSHIARGKLGHIMSWKEIAITNSLQSADALEPGQKIALYANLSAGGSGYSSNGQPSSAEGSTNPNFANSNPDSQTPTIQDESNIQFSPPSGTQQKVKEGKSGKSKSGLDIAKIIRQNLFLIIIGMGVILLLGALIVVNKKKRSRSSDEFNEDIFSEQMKK